MNTPAFIDHLKGLAKNNGIAKIKFDDNNDLGFVSRHLSDLVLIENESKDLDNNQIIENIILSLDNHKNTIEGRELFKTLDKIANAIVMNYQENKQYLTNIIGNKVTELSEAILEERKKIIQEDGYGPAFELSNNEKFTTMMWEGVELLGGKNVIEPAIRDLSKLSLPKLDRTGVVYSLPKLEYPEGDLTEVVDVEEVADTINDVLDETDKETVQEALELILDSKKTRKMVVDYTYNLTKGEVSPYLLSTKINNLIKNTYPVMQILSKMPFPGTASDKEFMDKNINALKQFMMVAGYYLLYSREVTFKDAIMLNNDTINNDLVDECTEMGISNEDLKTHVLVNYLKPGYPIGINGINIDTVKDSKDKNQIAIENLRQMEDSFKRDVLIDSTTKSFHRVMEKDKSMDNLWKGALESDQDFAARKYRNIQYSTNFLTGEDKCIEDTLYNYLIMMDRRSAVLGGLYNAFTIELSKQMEESDKLTDALLEDTERQVLSKVILNAVNTVFGNK